MGDDDAACSASTPQADAYRHSEILDADHVYEALAQPRRRYVCYAALVEGVTALPALANQVAARVYDVDASEVTDVQRERVYISLYHVHVPKLAAASVVEFDEERETVTPGRNAEQVLRAFEFVGASLDADRGAHERRTIDDERE